MRWLLLELAEEGSPFGTYARHKQSLRIIIDAVANLFGLSDASTDKYTKVYKLVVTDEGNDAYGITMTYSSEKTTIESELIEF